MLNNQKLKDILLIAKKYLIQVAKTLAEYSGKAIVFVKESDFLDKFKTTIVNSKAYNVFRERFLTGTVTIKKKNMTLAALCMFGVISAFSITYKSDIIKEDVEAQKSVTLNKEDSRKFPTISASGQRFATDARVVSEKLSNYDFNNDGKKVVYLTFDDGPSKYTGEILSILKKYNIRGTFFVTGTSLEHSGSDAIEQLKESYAYGNSIGNHTYSHDYKKLYPNGSLDLNAFKEDLDKNLSLLKQSLGDDFETNIVRCPGGFSSWKGMSVLKEDLDKNNQASIDWNSLTGDSTRIKNDKNAMIQEAITTSKDKNLVVLLMHETNKLTPQYLEELIKHYHEQGYEFRTLA